MGNTCPVEAKCYVKRTSEGNLYHNSTENPGEGWEEYSGVCYEEEACYTYNDEFFFGKYDNIAGYEKVANVSSSDECKGEKPDIVDEVPQTGMNTNIVVFLISFIFIVIGIRFIYFSNQKQDN